MIPDSILPTCNALFNFVSIVFLIRGYRAIRAGDKVRHRRNMLAALVASAAFLTCYLVYHFRFGSVAYPFFDWMRPVYYTILVPHVIMAALTAPFIFLVVKRAFKRDFERHKKLARNVWPAWLFVAVTGDLVYLLLYGRVYLKAMISA